MAHLIKRDNREVGRGASPENRLDLPGVKDEELEVSLSGNLLTISLSVFELSGGRVVQNGGPPGAYWPPRATWHRTGGKGWVNRNR